MDTNTMNEKLAAYFALLAQIDELAAQADAIKSELRSSMEEDGETSRIEGVYRMQLITVKNSRLDAKRLGQDYPQLVKEYTVVKPYTQFRVTKNEPKGE